MSLLINESFINANKPLWGSVQLVASSPPSNVFASSVPVAPDAPMPRLSVSFTASNPGQLLVLSNTEWNNDSGKAVLGQVYLSVNGADAMEAETSLYDGFVNVASTPLIAAIPVAAGFITDLSLQVRLSGPAGDTAVRSSWIVLFMS